MTNYGVTDITFTITNFKASDRKDNKLNARIHFIWKRDGEEKTYSTNRRRPIGNGTPAEYAAAAMAEWRNVYPLMKVSCDESKIKGERHWIVGRLIAI